MHEVSNEWKRTLLRISKLKRKHRQKLQRIRLQEEVSKRIKKLLDKKRQTNNFYKTREWRELRYLVIKNSNKTCQFCNATDKPLHVDHIKSRSKYPNLALDINNLQVLCEDCNLGKSNKFEDDWRPRG